MNAMKLLDLAIGLSFLYLLLSLLGSGIVEIISWAQGLRATTLQDAINKLLSNPTVATNVYAHPLVKGLQQTTMVLDKFRFWRKPVDGGEKLPSYIPKDTFATVLMDVLRGTPGTQLKLAEVEAAVKGLTAGSDLQKALGSILDEGVTDVAKARKAIGDWFDKAMERVSGEYKRYSQKVLMMVAIVLVFAINADSWRVASALWSDPALSAAVASAAVEASKDKSATAPDKGEPDLDKAIQRVVNANQKIDALKLPIGWKWKSIGQQTPVQAPGIWGWWILTKLLGLAFTVAAVSLGAPFWFDALNRLVNLRAAGKPPDGREGKKT
jgi:hypothetical protein